MSIRPSEHYSPDAFWGEIAPPDHVVQLYGDDGTFVDSLAGFVLGGLRNDEAVVVIATAAHHAALRERLILGGVDLVRCVAEDRYIPLDAEATLSLFMFRGWPNDNLFHAAIMQILRRARAGNRKVRAFGEMVAILWAEGHNGATVRLEHLWHQLCKKENFPLFCAYPRIGFTEDCTTAMRQICDAHSHVLSCPSQLAVAG
jgi:hypothetical protein